MSEENNVCAICGGLKGPVTREFLDHLLCSAPYTNPLFFKACPGHPEPAEKHDGSLDKRAVHDDYRATAEIQDDYGLCDGSKLVEVAGGRGDCENSRVLLEPSQALSLLAWLTQERAELQRLAKEQEQ